MNGDNWKCELDRLLKLFEQESTISLKKIKQFFKISGDPFNEDFRKYFLKISTLRLDSSFDTVLFEGLKENFSDDNWIETSHSAETGDDQHQMHIANDTIENQTESNNDHIDEVHVKCEPKIEIEMEDLPFVEFDPNKTDGSLEVEHGAVAAELLNVQSQSRPSISFQKHSKRETNGFYKCKKCEYSTLDKPNFNKHQLIHDGAKPFKCKHCDYASRQKVNLIRHQRTHEQQKLNGIEHDPNAELLKCTHCDQKFTKWCGLKSHLTRSHKDNRRLFNCERCMRRFTQKIEKDLHEIQCQNIRYECYLCKKYVTRWVTRMKEHMRTHSGAKPFQCAICNKSFRIKCNLKCHLNSIHNRTST